MGGNDTLDFGEHPSSIKPTLEDQLLSLTDGTSTEIASLLGVSVPLISVFLKQLPYHLYQEGFRGSQRTVTFTQEGVRRIIEAKNAYIPKGNPKPKQREKNKTPSHISYTDFMQTVGNYRGQKYRTAWSKMQKDNPQFFTTTPDHRIQVLREDYFGKAKEAFLKYLEIIEEITSIKVQKNIRRKPARRLLDPQKYANTIARQVGV